MNKLAIVLIGLAVLCAAGYGVLYIKSGQKIETTTIEDNTSEALQQNEISDGSDTGVMQDTSSVQGADSMQATNVADVPKANVDTNARATTLVAGGCFWCVEADLEKLQGVLSVVSGYAGGTTENPTYKNYAEGGHREVVEVTYNPTIVSFRDVIVYAIKHMDPTDAAGSFGDRGVQYSPALYYDTDIEKQTIDDVIRRINALKVYDKPLALKVERRPKFWKAEEYHQNYYKGTLTQLKYSYYRNASGRDAFIKKYWGTDIGPTLPAEKTPYDVSAWKGFVKPSDAELRTKLTALQYGVTQNHDTERAFDNTYWNNKEEGIYVDIVSGEPLFSSKDKFDSGTGWPSFTKPLYPEAVAEYSDYKLVVPRTEIRSQFAGSHLGHKFNDAPANLGGIRYCMNSASLRFIAKADLEKEGYGQFTRLFQ